MFFNDIRFFWKYSWLFWWNTGLLAFELLISEILLKIYRFSWIFTRNEFFCEEIWNPRFIIYNKNNVLRSTRKQCHFFLSETFSYTVNEIIYVTNNNLNIPRPYYNKFKNTLLRKHLEYLIKKKNSRREKSTRS